MEIHTPDHPPETWRETLKHLAMITAGVLIALAFEGAVAWVDHRMLVREAKANLLEEIRNNKNELEHLFVSIENEEKNFEHADEVAQQVLEHGPLEAGKVQLNLASNFAELKNAAVTTGQITGAFGYMDYATVKRFAGVYDLQAQFLRMQEREVQDFQVIYAFVPRLVAAKAPPAAAIEEWRGRVNTARAGFVFQEQYARVLVKRYDELLSKP